MPNEVKSPYSMQESGEWIVDGRDVRAVESNRPHDELAGNDARLKALIEDSRIAQILIPSAGISYSSAGRIVATAGDSVIPSHGSAPEAVDPTQFVVSWDDTTHAFVDTDEALSPGGLSVAAGHYVFAVYNGTAWRTLRATATDLGNMQTYFGSTFSGVSNTTYSTMLNMILLAACLTSNRLLLAGHEFAKGESLYSGRRATLYASTAMFSQAVTMATRNLGCGVSLVAADLSYAHDPVAETITLTVTAGAAGSEAGISIGPIWKSASNLHLTGNASIWMEAITAGEFVVERWGGSVEVSKAPGNLDMLVYEVTPENPVGALTCYTPTAHTGGAVKLYLLSQADYLDVANSYPAPGTVPITLGGATRVIPLGYLVKNPAYATEGSPYYQKLDLVFLGNVKAHSGSNIFKNAVSAFAFTVPGPGSANEGLFPAATATGQEAIEAAARTSLGPNILENPRLHITRSDLAEAAPIPWGNWGGSVNVVFSGISNTFWARQTLPEGSGYSKRDFWNDATQVTIPYGLIPDVSEGIYNILADDLDTVANTLANRVGYHLAGKRARFTATILPTPLPDGTSIVLTLAVRKRNLPSGTTVTLASSNQTITAVQSKETNTQVLEYYFPADVISTLYEDGQNYLMLHLDLTGATGTSEVQFIVGALTCQVFLQNGTSNVVGTPLLDARNIAVPINAPEIHPRNEDQGTGRDTFYLNLGRTSFEDAVLAVFKRNASAPSNNPFMPASNLPRLGWNSTTELWQASHDGVTLGNLLTDKEARTCRYTGRMDSDYIVKGVRCVQRQSGLVRADRDWTTLKTVSLNFNPTAVMCNLNGFLVTTRNNDPVMPYQTPEGYGYAPDPAIYRSGTGIIIIPNLFGQTFDPTDGYFTESLVVPPNPDFYLSCVPFTADFKLNGHAFLQGDGSTVCSGQSIQRWWYGNEGNFAFYPLWGTEAPSNQAVISPAIYHGETLVNGRTASEVGIGEVLLDIRRIFLSQADLACTYYKLETSQTIGGTPLQSNLHGVMLRLSFRIVISGNQLSLQWKTSQALTTIGRTICNPHPDNFYSPAATIVDTSDTIPDDAAYIKFLMDYTVFGIAS